ncbi:MAG TPA: cytochrome P450 [Candidatus Bathyarchaeia archaeon]|nr:cytochrome P450 [Candidatus Bathyarchaeia archaeon]
MRLAEVDLVNPENYVPGVPHDAFQVLRKEAPIFWHKEPDGGAGFWALTRYDDVMAVSKDPGTFSSYKGGTILRDIPEDDLNNTRTIMLNMDPPQHARYRRLVSQGFTPRMTAALEPHIREIADKIIDAVIARGECDFVTEIAAELPLQVIAELLGIPLEDRHKVFEWSNRLIGFDDPEFQNSMEEGKLAAMEMYMYANQLALERKGSPRDDLVSVLMNGIVEGEQLSELEFDSFFLLLAVAGNETTRNLISGGMLALIENHAERARLLADPSLLPSAVEEMLRYVSPVMHFRRTATRDTEIRGQKIREGEKVTVWYISANRDEEVFPHANRFDAGRAPNNHLAFGIGEHFCLGSNLARLEIRIMFEQLLRRMPDIELAGPVARLRSNFINGVKRMPVRYTRGPLAA